LTINAVAEALKVRAKGDPPLTRAVSEDVGPLDVALAAGKIAADALHSRQASSSRDGMALTAEEQRVVAGRVVGVVMRLAELEGALRRKCAGTTWIARYGEWDAFGVLSDETVLGKIDDRIVADPLFRMNRAECLLALYLDTVEQPELASKNATVPDGSSVDFLDADRRDVLLENQAS
jgi:hypothetical protein